MSAPDAAVQIAAREVAGHHYGVRDVCDALHKREWLHDPTELARLRADLARIGEAVGGGIVATEQVLARIAALEAVAAAGMVWQEQSADPVSEVTLRRALHALPPADEHVKCRTRRIWKDEHGRDVRGPWEPCATCPPAASQPATGDDPGRQR